jgi:hypothetical protein
MLTIADPNSQTDLNREIARAAFTRCNGQSFFNPAPFRDAARLMGLAFTAETEARLRALCTVQFSDIPSAALEWLTALRAAILA